MALLIMYTNSRQAENDHLTLGSRRHSMNRISFGPRINAALGDRPLECTTAADRMVPSALDAKRWVLASIWLHANDFRSTQTSRHFHSRSALRIFKATNVTTTRAALCMVGRSSPLLTPSWGIPCLLRQVVDAQPLRSQASSRQDCFRFVDPSAGREFANSRRDSPFLMLRQNLLKRHCSRQPPRMF